jgi:hypothetical protein
MSFNVRIFAYTGIAPVLQPQVVQKSDDSVFVLRDPYLTGQKLVSNGATPVPSNPMPAGTRVARVEVDDGQTIRYEVIAGANSGNNARAPSTTSPTLSGRELVWMSDGAIFSFVDASAV